MLRKYDVRFMIYLAMLFQLWVM